MVRYCRWFGEVTSLNNIAHTLVIARHVAQKRLMQQVQMFLTYTHLDIQNITIVIHKFMPNDMHNKFQHSA